MKNPILAAVITAASVLSGFYLLTLYDTSLSEGESEVDRIEQSEPVPDPILPAKPAKLTVKLTEREKDCLARNIYYEAGIESKTGKIAVAQVTYNRLKSGRWGNDICKVVHSKKQFSWTLDSKKLFGKPSGVLWAQSLEAQNEFIEGARVRSLDDSLHYHTDYIKAPVWTKGKKVKAKIGKHIFYQS